MTQHELESFRRRLQATLQRLGRDRAHLEEETRRTAGGEASGGLSDTPIHIADLGSHEYEEEIGFDLLENEETLIEEINAAVERIDRGTFGRCESCQKPIGHARLHAVPYARECIDCARSDPQEALAPALA